MVACVSARAGRDGHAGVFALDHWHSLPLSIYAFADGWHVLDAMDPHGNLAGARITTLGGMPIEQVIERLTPLLARENEHGLLNKPPRALLVPEVLHAVGVGESRSEVTLGLEVDGAQRSVKLAGAPMQRVRGWRRSLGMPLPTDSQAMWLGQPQRA
ncbi:MAG: hypothetical protein ACI8QZ_000135 [Chlamydiales bacterium]|jgi:hypothetical protein